MAGQGKIISIIAKLFNTDPNWVFVYKCVPNTPHFGVVPITTPRGASSQRYPDIVATNGVELSIVEVEVRLTPATVADIKQRFTEMREALTEPDAWSSWRDQVQRVCGVQLATTFVPKCTLVLCQPPRVDAIDALELLSSANISVCHWSDFQP